MHHAFHGDLITDRRHQHSITGLQPLHIAVNTMQDKVVQIDILDQLLSPEVPCNTHRSSCGRPARRVECVQHRRHRTDVVCTRAHDIAYDINSNAAQLRKRYGGMDISEACVQQRFHRLLQSAKRLTRRLKRSYFRKRDLSLAVNWALNMIRYAAPDINAQSVSRANDVIRSHWQIHRQIEAIPRRPIPQSAKPGLRITWIGGFRPRVRMFRVSGSRVALSRALWVRAPLILCALTWGTLAPRSLSP